MQRIRIICVDDDPVCLAQLKTRLGEIQNNFDMRFFDKAGEALAEHRSHPADIVISDLRMPEMDGVALIGAMREAHPGAIYMIQSGQADLESAVAAVNVAGVFRFLLKETDASGLKLAIDSAITEINCQRLRSIEEASHRTLNRLHLGVLMLNESGEVIFRNESAGRILQAKKMLQIGWDGVLRAEDPRLSREFQDFLQKVRLQGEESEGSQIFRFEGRESGKAVTASVTYHASSSKEGGYFSVVLCDPSETRTSVASISAALNILPSEAKIVHALAEGATMEAAAESAGISLSSARTYLKSVFFKTGVARQSELVRLVMLTTA